MYVAFLKDAFENLRDAHLPKREGDRRLDRTHERERGPFVNITWQTVKHTQTAG